MTSDRRFANISTDQIVLELMTPHRRQELQRLGYKIEPLYLSEEEHPLFLLVYAANGLEHPDAFTKRVLEKNLSVTTAEQILSKAVDPYKQTGRTTKVIIRAVARTLVDPNTPVIFRANSPEQEEMMAREAIRYRHVYEHRLQRHDPKSLELFETWSGEKKSPKTSVFYDHDFVFPGVNDSSEG